MTHGSTSSFEALLGQQGRLRAMARAIVKDAAAADDVVQEALLAAWRHAPHAPLDARGWLARVARNLALDHVRAQAAESALPPFRAPLVVKQVLPVGVVALSDVRQEGDGSFGRLLVPERAAVAELRDEDGRLLGSAPLTLSASEPNELEL